MRYFTTVERRYFASRHWPLLSAAEAYTYRPIWHLPPPPGPLSSMLLSIRVHVTEKILPFRRPSERAEQAVNIDFGGSGGRTCGGDRSMAVVSHNLRNFYRQQLP